MRVLPVFARELRTESRQWFTYWLRVLGALAGLLTFAFTYSVTSLVLTPQQQGGVLFSNVHTAVFVAIWLLVPLLTADCLSRERREGTLGLLFLTPLTPTGVVLGKLSVHLLRALMLWLALVPILTLPFLLGGVSGSWVLSVLLTDSTSICLALAAGLLASAHSSQWHRALIATGLIALLFLCALAAVQAGLFLVQHVWAGAPVPQFPPPAYWFVGGFVLMTGASNMWSATGLGGPGFHLLIVHTECFLLSLLILFGVVRHTARHVARHWQEVPPTARRLWWERLFLEPRFWRRLLHSRMRRMLERNPIGWLQQYRATARVSKWGWCLFFVVVDCVVSSNTSWYDMAALHLWLGIFLLLGLSFSAAGSFRRERETGALELILVTPIRERQLIWGRLRGLWSQFLPAAVFAIGLYAWLDHEAASMVWWWRRPEETAARALILAALASTFLCVPIIGLYFSLRRKTFLVAWLSTVGTAVVLPGLAGIVLVIAVLWLGNRLRLDTTAVRWTALAAFGTSLLLQAASAARCGHRLLHLLRQRQWSG